jgi:uncharacterized protein (TIGR03086 family)
VNTESLERTNVVLTGVLAKVTASELDGPTPCKSWTVRDLVNHIVGATHFFLGVVETDTMPGDVGRDYSAGDFNAEFAANSARLLAAFSRDGLDEELMTLPSGTVPRSIGLWIAARELFIHGWDLAKATGQSTNLDPELAEWLLEAPLDAIPDKIRGDEPLPFGRMVPVPDDASATDRLVGSFGRQP